VKRLLALTGIAIVLSAAPAGALTQSNTRTYTFSGQVTVVNTGFKVQFTPGNQQGPIVHTLTTPSASAINFNPVVINQSNTNP
jgi:hypothetical protein